MNLDFVGQGLSREERETSILRSDADDAFDIYTSSPVMARRLEKLAESWRRSDHETRWMGNTSRRCHSRRCLSGIQ